MTTIELPDLLRYEDLVELGLTRHRFDRLLESGEFERIAAGIFLRAEIADDTTAARIAIAVKRPTATIALLSAAAHHELTDEIPTATDIAIPRGTQPIRIDIAPIAWHRFDPDTFRIGRTRLPLAGGVEIGIYSAERTIVDLFRLRHGLGSDLAVEALKRWLAQSGNIPSALLATSRAFPQALPAIRSALEVLL